MKILITGANGFLGQNLIERLVKMPDVDILHYSTGTSPLLLERNLCDCDFLFHFAAVHRPKDNGEFYKVNVDFFRNILNKLEKAGNRCPVLLTSSIQATDNNDYGRSKRIAEELLREHGRKMQSPVVIYRLLNTFGKWARPNSHSVVATFCHNIARDLPIVISNQAIQMRFYCVDDVIDSFVGQIGAPLDCQENFMCLPDEMVHTITLGELADTLRYFRSCEIAGVDPQLETSIQKKLFPTYNSYRPIQ